MLAAKKAAKERQGAAAAELEAATKVSKEQLQQLQGAARAAESRAAAAEKEAAKARACVKSQADQLCSARAEAASYKKEAMSLVDRVLQLDKSTEVRACLSAVCCLEWPACFLLVHAQGNSDLAECCGGVSARASRHGCLILPLGWL